MIGRDCPIRCKCAWGAGTLSRVAQEGTHPPGNSQVFAKSSCIAAFPPGQFSATPTCALDAVQKRSSQKPVKKPQSTNAIFTKDALLHSQVVAKVELHGRFYTQPVLNHHMHGGCFTSRQQGAHGAPAARRAVQLLPVCGQKEAGCREGGSVGGTVGNMACHTMSG